MALHYIFLFMFLVPILVGFLRFMFETGGEGVLHQMVDASLTYGEKGIKITLFFMLPMMILWLGLMNIAEKGGAINFIAKIINPFFNKLFPDVPQSHPARGSIVMNYAANILGLDNAATPLGLKAMNELQELNPNKDTASNAQIMFLVLNTSGLSIIPLGVITLRADAGASDIMGVFVPVLISTFIATLVALLIVGIKQKINLFNPTVLAYLLTTSALVGGVMYLFHDLPREVAEAKGQAIGDSLYLFFIAFFLLFGWVKKINVFESFIDGAKEAFKVAVMIFPYIVGFLVMIGVFVASGTMDYFTDGISAGVDAIGMDNRFVEAIPVALMKPINGKAAQAMAMEVFNHCNECSGVGAVVDTVKNISLADCKCVDTFAGKLASTVQGTTDTTFYILAVYFGSVGIKKIRYAAWAGLMADLAGIIAAIVVAYLFYG